MRQNKMSSFIKKYPVMIGMALIMAVMVLILGIKLYERKSAVEATTVTESMTRPATVDGFSAGTDVVRYFVGALQENDLDKAMRAFPIDERVLGIDAAKVIDLKGEFSSAAYPPSADYVQYTPVASSEIAGEYAQAVVELQKALDWGSAELTDVNILYPEKQLSGEYQKHMLEQCESWGADAMCEMTVKIKSSDKLYMLPVTIIKYGDMWKVFCVGASLLGEQQREMMSDAISNDPGAWLMETEEREYDRAIDEEREDDVWTALDKKKTVETTEPEYIEEPEAQLLPPNYFLANQAYVQTPEEVITQFSKYLEKEDITSALCYGYLGHEQLESDPSEVLIRQKEFAGEIADLYYGMLLEKKETKIQTLDELGMTGKEIVKELNPENIPYMDLKTVLSLGGNEYCAVYYYGREYYMAGFTMTESGAGWQIESLASEKAGLKDGGVKKITEEEYERLAGE